MNIAIINFNSASFSEKMQSFAHLYTINLDVQINEKSYMNSTLDELFLQVKESKEIPKTSQPSPSSILETYNKVVNEYDKILVLTPTPDLSGTHQVAVSTLDMLENKDKFEIINTKSFALSEAIICDKAISMIENNEKVENIIETLNDLADKITTYIIPGSFDYLKMGGRVNTSKMVIGKIMNLKILVEHKKGLAQVKATTRGYKKLFGEIEKILNDSDAQLICTGEINSEEKLYSTFIDLLSNDNEVLETKKTSIIMASHFGPNTLGFAIVQK